MNDNYKVLLDYINWLLTANKREKGELKPYEVCFQFGVLSEVYEAKAASPETQLNECGDVLAYGVLALSTMGETPERIAQVLSVDNFVATIDTEVKEYTDNLAKYYRGDDDKDARYFLAIDNIFNMIGWAAFVTGVSPTILTYYNREKLTARLANVGTFKGSGDR